MNGEVEQMSRIVMCARKALHDNSEIDYITEGYLLSIRFLFKPREKTVEKPVVCDSVYSWFQTCKKHDMEEIKLFVPTSVEDRNILGFSNTSRGSIICFWKDGNVTFFSPIWEFDRKKEGWNVLYQEQIWKDAPKGKPVFINKTEEFKHVLADIENLAIVLGFKNFADNFHKAYEALCDSSHLPDDWIPAYISDDVKGIYYAVMTADQFGGMSSWNDCPSCEAETRGLGKLYDELSDKLLEQIRYNTMYIVNESWI